MPIRFQCPHCHRLLSVSRRKIGLRVSCPKCNGPAIVPAGEDGAPPPENTEQTSPEDLPSPPTEEEIQSAQSAESPAEFEQPHIELVYDTPKESKEDRDSAAGPGDPHFHGFEKVNSRK